MKSCINKGKRKPPKRKRGKASEKIMAARFGRYVNSGG
jgi:hypothetical protein